MAATLKKAVAVKMLIALKFQEAAKWPDAKIVATLMKLPKRVTDDDLAKVEPPQARSAIKGLIAKITAGETVELTDTGAAAAPAKAGTKAKPAKAAKEKSGPGVIESIIEFVTAASATNPIDKAGVLAKLVKRFPERGEDQMKTTVGIQLPSRLNKEKLNGRIKKNEKGYYLGK